MNSTNIAMTVLKANPFVFYFSLAVLAAVAMYVGYATLDRLGLPAREAQGTVAAKKFYPRGEAPVVTIAGGRPWILRQEKPEIYLLTLSIDGNPMHVAVTSDEFKALRIGDGVKATVQRTRFSGVDYLTNLRH